MNRSAFRMGLVAAAFGAAGCSGGERPSGSVETTVDTLEASVVHVRNRGAPPRWRLEPAYEVGIAEAGGSAPDPRELGRVHGIAVDAAGGVWIGDVQARQVRRFGPDGRFAGAFGREGQGPGEMRSLQSLAWLGPDTLALLDSSQGRVLLFSPEGASLGQLPYPGGVTGPPDFVRFYPVSAHEAYAFAPDGAGGRTYLRFAAEGREGSLPMRPMEDAPPAGGATVCPLPDGGIRFFSVPFAPRAFVRPAAAGLVLEARSDRMRFRFAEPDGRAVRIVEDEVEVLPVTDADWEEATADWRAWRAENPGVRCEDEPDRPRLQPPLLDLHPDPEGRLWAEVRGAGGPAFRIYDAEGRLLARAEAPPRSHRIPPAFAPGWLAVLDEGPLGEDVVRVYRIREGDHP